jgi:ribosome-binding protein aMBF1 (putative translation factor)
VGGLGSGRRRTRLGIDECRALEIGELCDQGRWRSQPRGVVLWRTRHGGETLARLTYVISRQEDAAEDLLLTYRYAPEGTGLSVKRELELDCAPGQRAYASCPGCGRRVRTLYAPQGAELFACRSCYRLVYRRSQWREQLTYVQEVAGPALRQLQALPSRTRRQARRRYVTEAPAALARELEAAPRGGVAEPRLWCLRLRAAGLSYRQIAALLEISKSSVARTCAAGPKAISTQALMRERLEEASFGPAPPEGEDLRSLDAYLRATHHHALRLGLYHHPLSEREERVVIPGDAVAED